MKTTCKVTLQAKQIIHVRKTILLKPYVPTYHHKKISLINDFGHKINFWDLFGIKQGKEAGL